MKMWMLPRILPLILYSVMFGIVFSHSARAQECELNCKGNCSAEGICTCDLPSPDSILSGDRPFFGGVFCQTESVMCDGTNSFWCENGGTCNELIQGENYTCACPIGFAGEMCNLTGVSCGNTYCYNDGVCQDISGVGSCECPPELNGSPDCSLPTASGAADSIAPTTSIETKHNRAKWLVPFSTTLAALLLVCCLGGVAIKCYRNRMRRQSQSRFQELQQLHLHDSQDFYDDGDEDGFKEGKTNRKVFG